MLEKAKGGKNLSIYICIYYELMLDELMLDELMLDELMLARFETCGTRICVKKEQEKKVSK